VPHVALVLVLGVADVNDLGDYYDDSVLRGKSDMFVLGFSWMGKRG
jgi:hypothetical protein